VIIDVDAERGVILRLECQVGGAPFQVVEVTSIDYDGPVPSSLFALEPPSGPVRSLIGSAITLDEAADRAPFTVLAPAHLPDDAGQLFVYYLEGGDARPASVLLFIAPRVVSAGATWDVHIHQAADPVAMPDSDHSGWEAVDVDGSPVMVWQGEELSGGRCAQDHTTVTMHV
jgi:hypothetical protein